MDKMRALRYFIKVVETSSFTQAAKALSVPASSVSRRIRDLEAELKVDLFHRSTRVVKLSDLGQIYYEQVKDIITALDVIEHIDDDAGSLQILHRALGDDGTAIITVPAYQFLWSQHDVDNQHKRRYSKSELKRKLEEAGFKVEKMTFCPSCRTRSGIQCQTLRKRHWIALRLRSGS